MVSRVVGALSFFFIVKLFFSVIVLVSVFNLVMIVLMVELFRVCLFGVVGVNECSVFNVILSVDIDRRFCFDFCFKVFVNFFFRV